MWRVDPFLNINKGCSCEFGMGMVLKLCSNAETEHNEEFVGYEWREYVLCIVES